MKADGASVTVTHGGGPTVEVLRAGRTHLLGEKTGVGTPGRGTAHRRTHGPCKHCTGRAYSAGGGGTQVVQES